MLSVKNSYNEVVIKKSKFITYLFKVDTINDVNRYLDDFKIRYKDADHICYAYILDSIKRCSDDGEPSKTAGMPILGVLENNSLNHVLCLVIRYFGGIKLGANGLVRAYSGCCREVVRNNIINIDSGVLVSICFNYDKTKIIDDILKNCFITNKNYGDNVCYEFKICNDDYNKIFDDLFNHSVSIKKIKECYLEKR